MTYEPNPVDTSGVEIPEDLTELIELLAENFHDNLSKRIIAQGWSWGEQWDSQKKTHPDLIPYSELQDQQKNYDRKAVTETVKAILAIGFVISWGGDLPD